MTFLQGPSVGPLQDEGLGERARMISCQVKKSRVLSETQGQSYGVSLAIWLTKVNNPSPRLVLDLTTRGEELEG